MVKVREEYPVNSDGSIDVSQWLERLPVDPAVDKVELLRACNFSQFIEQQPNTDSPNSWGKEHSRFRIGMEMVEILADLHLDTETLVAAVIYRLVREHQLELDVVRENFGERVATLIEGVIRMAAMSKVIAGDTPVLGQASAQKENIRKMLVALVDDVRVALLKLAERTCAIRAVKNNPTRRYLVAREVFDIYAPLAHRLGIGHIKWELEDLSFRYLHAASYKKIAKLLDEKRLARQRYIEEVKQLLSDVLAKNAIEAELSGRVKHIYSIWRKMQRKGIGFSQVYDIRAVRILVPELKDCYAVLGLVHGLWRNIANEFDDYIANPKDNGYRSLHTAVIGPEGKVLEIQIRTFAMHEESEYGVCAHWRYKGADRHGGSSYEDKIAWLRQVLDWHEEIDGGTEEITKRFANAQDRVYVFTPDGHVVNLAQGSTPLDFAYHIHTEVGHRCRGAKVNGRIVSLTYALATGEQVEILTGKENNPKRDWLQPSLHYLQSSRARSKVQAWFRLQAREDNVAAGRALVEKVFKRMALTSLDYKTVATYFGYQVVEDMYAAVGAGDINTAQILAVSERFDKGVEAPVTELVTKPPRVDEGSNNIIVQGVGNLLTHFARCCKPVPGDMIMGYVTQGRGVSIHLQDCAKLLQLQHNEPERIIEVNWGDAQKPQSYPVDLEVTAFDRQGLLRDVTTLLANAKVDVIAMQTTTNKKDHTALMALTVEMSGLAELSNLLSRINSLPNVSNAYRVREDKK
ncbi:GTP diphosphokinase [Dasania marina]|uniref:GTP diphosphokinase n=1 Tax=Dasania marina TaxID=471499 RepID=UPI00037AFF33|nr:GTP diphosphokinase [Dasania marina]